jgi:hypothetical protein
MTKQTINIGATPNDKQGDSLRAAFTKINTNFTELYSAIGADVQIPIQTGNAGKVLTTNGTTLSWTNASGGATDRLVNGDNEVILGAGGVLAVPGTVTFPYQGTNQRTGWAESLVFTKSNDQKSIATQEGTSSSPTVERLVIAGGDSYYNNDTSLFQGEGGDIYLWAGRGANGGDIKIDAGNALGPHTYDQGGTIKIRGGSSAYGDSGFIEISTADGAQNGGDINIATGDGGNSGGNINITAGQGVEYEGQIVLSTVGGQRPWTFGGDGSLTFPHGAGFGYGESGQLKVNDGVTLSLDLRDNYGRGFYTNSDGYTLRSNGSYSWTFGSDAILSLPQNLSVGAAVIQPNASTFGLKLISNGNTWAFGTNGSMTFPDNTTQTTAYQKVAAPAHSYGAASDTVGMVAFDDNYIYYCKQNYVNNSTNIWVRVAWSGTSW